MNSSPLGSDKKWLERKVFWNIEHKKWDFEMLAGCFFDAETGDYYGVSAESRQGLFYVMKTLRKGSHQVEESVRLKEAFDKAMQKNLIVGVTDEATLAELLLLGL